MSKTTNRKRLAIAAARNFVAGLIENSELASLDSLGLSDEEFEVARAEVKRIAERIQSTVNQELLAQLGTPEERMRRALDDSVGQYR